MRERVYVVQCPDYGQAEDKLGELLTLMGGVEGFAKPGDNILLKVNLLQPATPEQAVSTHPAVAAAAAKLILGAGAKATICDSPGSGYKHSLAMLKKLYGTNGMEAAAAESGAALNFDLGYREVSYPAGKLVKRLEVMDPVLEADGVWNLCKLKTHAFMGMTGAVKNNFGVIPGRSKVGYHAKFQDKTRFADMLLDLAAFVSPRISIMDAVVGMEGDGPGTSGTPRQIGLLLAAEDPVALDTVAAEIIGFPRAENGLLFAAERRGMGPTRIEDIEIVGGVLDRLRIPDYRLPGHIKRDMTGGMPGAVAQLARRAMTRTPRVIPEKCVGCGICRDSCPAGAISMMEGTGKARVDAGSCIRCYCCHELCPMSAVELKAGAGLRFLGV